jgi:polysaccharide export outer membrane protein
VGATCSKEHGACGYSSSDDSLRRAVKISKRGGLVRKRIVLLLIAATVALGQPRPESLPYLASTPQNKESGNQTPQAKQPLAINDQLVIFANEVEGISDRPFRVELDGAVNLPLVGKVRALGLTLEEFEKELTSQFMVYVRSPRISVKRLTTQADTIVVAGAFKNPGVYALPERRTLLDVLTAVGGLQPNAGRTIKITRRLAGASNPLPAAVEDRASGVSTATINLSRLIENPLARDEVTIEPHDVLFAGPAGVVFLTGEVLRPGPFELADRESFGVTELISLAGGLGREAEPDKTKILRPILNGSRRAEIAVDVKKILAGNQSDFPVLPNDMVVVPRAQGKKRALKSVAMFVGPALATTLIYVVVRR